MKPDRHKFHVCLLRLFYGKLELVWSCSWSGGVIPIPHSSSEGVGLDGVREVVRHDHVVEYISSCAKREWRWWSHQFAGSARVLDIWRGVFEDAGTRYLADVMSLLDWSMTVWSLTAIILTTRLHGL